MLVVANGARPPDLVPFWKPPNITDSTISTTISSSTQSRQPPARDRGQRRRLAPYRSGRPNKDLYIRLCMPGPRAICRPRRII